MIGPKRVWMRYSSSAYLPYSSRRWLSASSLEERLNDRVQAYWSRSRDPYVNLSIEHYLFQKSAPESTILFQYINRPSVIIGRNQNPWLEVNLALLNPGRPFLSTEPPELGAVDLVRRRSGGGTVFHDGGNVNWTVICPSASFTRDKHVEMVVRALRSCGIDRARVNKRHDVVLDQGEEVAEVDRDDTHVTAYTKPEDAGMRPVKVSGSAYKLTRGRALHHGTCLLSSPNLNVIPHYLHSPAKPYITARGVESVSSPVGNILLENEEFSEALQAQFAHIYNADERLPAEELDEGLTEVDSICKGIDELKSADWKFLQTPQFTISNANDAGRNFNMELTVRHGLITDGHLSHSNTSTDKGEMIAFPEHMRQKRLDEISSWHECLGSHLASSAARSEICNWLQQNLPVPQGKNAQWTRH